MLRVLIVGEAKGQPVVGLDVQLPHQVFLPRRENLGVDRLHVGIGQQTQHTQVVGIPHEIGELIDHMLVAEIAPHNDFRHLQMMFDDEHHLVPLDQIVPADLSDWAYSPRDNDVAVDPVLGRIVFSLIDVGLLASQPTDKPEDFEHVYDFAAEFRAGYPWPGVERG